MKDLNIIVVVVNTRQLRKVTFADMCNLSMRELNMIVIVIVMFVTTRQIQKGIYTYMCDLPMKELHMIVMFVTQGNYKRQPLITHM